jgi:uncharacterized protein (DUF1501 family)
MGMDDCVRRSVLKGGALALFGLTAEAAGIPRFLVRAAHAGPAGRRKVLVAVFQRGAVDGLSMVVPHGDPAYYAARASIAIGAPASGKSETAIDLDGFFAFHPALEPIKPLWDARRLAVVHACGSPVSTRSHFDAQDYMETGTPGVKTTPDGWLSRGLVARARTSPSPFRAVALGPQLPRALRGEIGAVVMPSVSDFDVRSDVSAMASGVNARRGFEALYEQGVRDLIHGTGRETFEAVKMLKAADPRKFEPANGARYPRTDFGEKLRQVAQLIKADVGLEVAFVDIAGWDTHAGQGNERGQLSYRLADFSHGLAAFARDLGDAMEDVLVLTMSEFGRTVRENGNRGTDHGHATAMLVVGGSVRGGRVYGRWPGLAPEQLFEERDLAVTTDFRQLFAEVAFKHLGIPREAKIFPGFAPPRDTPLGVLA